MDSGASRPSISVVIPAYNAERYLAEAIEAALQQTWRPAEVIVVDDGSTDGTADIVRRFGAPVVLVQQPNAGEGAARNRGIDAATGDYIAFIDADDTSLPERFERQIAALRQASDSVACFTGHWTFDKDRRLRDYPIFPPGPSTESLDYLCQCIYVGATLMFDRSRACGLRYPEARGVSGVDMVFSSMLATRGRIVTVPDTLYGYRSHTTQISIGLRATSDSNAFFEFRHGWANAHWQEFWPDKGWPEVQRRLWAGLVEQTKAAYWTRDKAYFLKDRNYLRRRWPEELPRPDVVGWRWYPDWMWQLKSAMDRLRKMGAARARP